MADQPWELFVFSIEIGDGTVDELLMRPTDDPGEVAQCFCLKNDLTAKAQYALERYLQSELKDFSKVELARREPSYPNKVHLVSPAKNALPAYSNFQHIRRKAKHDQARAKIPSSEQFKGRAEVSLIKRGIQKERDMLEKRLQSQKDELAYCTFTPNISHKSREIVKRKKRNSKSIEPTINYDTPIAHKNEAFKRIYDILPTIIQGHNAVSKLLQPILQDLDPDFTYEQFYSSIKYYFDFLNPEEQDILLNV